MKTFTAITLLLALLTCAACATREERALSSASGKSPHRLLFIHSEEIQNPKELRPGGTVMVKADPLRPYGVESAEGIKVRLPASTPFAAHSAQERSYLKGYVLGYLDAACQSAACRSNAGDRLLVGWNEGWEVGFAHGDKASALTAMATNR